MPLASRPVYFRHLSITWKLLLASLIPVVTIIALSVLTFQSVQTFSDDEEQLSNIYFIQRRSAEYMRLVVDLETGFRGYVLTKQDLFLRPFRLAQSRILDVGNSLQQAVQKSSQRSGILSQVQKRVGQLMKEKDELIEAIKAGQAVNAIHYVEIGRGRALMVEIRDDMNRFDRLEQAELYDALGRISRDRSLMVMVILGGGSMALVLLVSALLLISRSMTVPLDLLVRVVGSARAGTVPQVPLMDRKDEIGALARVMHGMGAQLQEHIAQLERSEIQLRQVNLDLSTSESKYRDIVTHAPLGIFTTHGMEVNFSNRDNRLLAGLDPDDDSNTGAFWDAIHPQDRERVATAFAACVKEHRAFDGVFRFLHKDGTIRVVLSRAVPIRNVEGAVTAYQGFNVDITAREQMQEVVNRSKRLATLGQVAAGIAHEIRNPLVGIGSNMSLLLDDLAPSDPRRAEVEVVLKEAKRLDRIVHQIIDFARPHSLAPQVFSVQDLTAEVLALLERTMQERRITTHCQFHPNLASPCADRDHIKQVLLNVLQNAIDSMEDGGKLSVVAYDTARGFKPGMLVQVSDTGKGIAPSDLPHVFEPFFTKGKSQGTGLGLAISHNLIESHHGEIQVASQPGAGTTVSIWLPLQQDVAT